MRLSAACTQSDVLARTMVRAVIYQSNASRERCPREEELADVVIDEAIVSIKGGHIKGKGMRPWLAPKRTLEDLHGTRVTFVEISQKSIGFAKFVNCPMTKRHKPDWSTARVNIALGLRLSIRELGPAEACACELVLLHNQFMSRTDFASYAVRPIVGQRRVPQYLQSQLDLRISELIASNQDRAEVAPTKCSSSTGVDHGRGQRFHEKGVPQMVDVRFESFTTDGGTEVHGPTTHATFHHGPAGYDLYGRVARARTMRVDNMWAAPCNRAL